MKSSSYLIVQKYGGTTLSNAEKIKRVASHIAELKKTKAQLVVVVSAMGKMTDALLRLAFRITSQPNQRELDMLMTTGERVSMSLLAMALEDLGVQAISFTGSQSGIVTTSHHTDAKIIELKTQRIEEALRLNKVVIIAGFQGVSREKEVTTLGRGGSDTTAVALAAHLKASRCEIYTDVEGIFSADPRLCGTARRLDKLPLRLGFKMASLGAKMHPRSMALAHQHRVPLWIGSLRSASKLGTLFYQKDEVEMETNRISAVLSKKNLSCFEFEQTPTSFLDSFASSNIPIKWACSQPQKTQWVIEKDKAPILEKLCNSVELTFKKTTDVQMVSVVSEGFLDHAAILPKVYQILEDLKVQLLFSTSQEDSALFLISTKQLSEVISTLHRKLVEEGLS